MIIREVILSCRKCRYKTGCGGAPMIISSKKWLKDKIKSRQIICPSCGNDKRFDIVWENGDRKTYYPGESWT